MYEIYLINDGVKSLLHSDNISNAKDSIGITDGTIIEGINSIDSFSFTILPNNPNFFNIYPYTTLVEVINTKTQKDVFYGRVVKPKVSMETNGVLQKVVECESEMGYLCDSLMEYLPEQYWNVNETTYDSDGNIEKCGVLEYVLGVHNSKMPEEKQIFVGNVDIEDDEEILYFGMQQHTNAYDTLQEKLIDNLGGEMYLYRGDDDKLYLDYVEEIGEVKTTSIKLRKNMQSLSKETDPTSFITRLYPLGAKITKTSTDSNGNETEVETDERVGCEDANDGIPYVDDEEGIETYGIIEGYYTWDHVTQPATLLSHAKLWLANNNKVKQKYVITALDLSTINLDIDSFEVGNYYPIVNDLLGVDDTLRITKKTINVCQPESSQLEIGDKYATLTELQLKRENTLKNELVDSITTVENNATYNVVTTSNYLTSLINQFADSIETLIQETVVTYSDFDEYKEIISTMFTQTKDSFNYTFTTLQESITELNGIVSTNQNELVKYIRFEDGNIILGVVGNEILLKESNDRISFLQNNIEVAYFSNNKLYVNNAEFPYGIKIYDISITQESNGSYTIG